jgi:hypothetical protein
MMHPTVVAALSAERHADLLRAAEAHRRVAAAPARHHGQTTLSRMTDGLDRAVASLRTRFATSTEPEAELCCA